MADKGLNQPVIVQATRLDATVLPTGFSQAFSLYLIQQGLDFGSVAGKANDAGQGAYSAQVRNDEQDIELADHEKRISQAEETLEDHEQRIIKAEEKLVDHEERIKRNTDDIASLDTRLDAAEENIDQLQEEQRNLELRVEEAESDIDNLQGDYVSKSAILTQSLASPLNVTSSYSVDGTKVLGARVTGFTAATGTALKGAFNANTAFTVSATYTQAEAQAIATALVATRQRVKALEDALRLHGLIN